MKITTNTEKETIEFAKELAKNLKGGEIIGLIGDLGAGKTVFSKGLAKGLGIKDMITSPTYVVMKVYDVPKHQSIKKLCHIDAYRLGSENDIEAIGAPEYLERKDTVTIIEWPDKIKKILPDYTVVYNFQIKNNSRIITLKK
jgi:tRNA threonylcarbamoyladenosine biosynthesis protein TsaE